MITGHSLLGNNLVSMTQLFRMDFLMILGNVFLGEPIQPKEIIGAVIIGIGPVIEVEPSKFSGADQS